MNTELSESDLGHRAICPRDDRDSELAGHADRARWKVIENVAAAKAGHIGGPLSMMDILVSLYFEVLNVRPDEPDWPDRDRFILSKGHSALGLYAVMAARGFFSDDELSTFDQGDSRLQGHPDVTRLPGIDGSSGSLGQGLSLGLGMAMAAHHLGRTFRTFVMLGDGELQEGMVWEAVQAAGRFSAGNLTAIVDMNGLQQWGMPRTEGDPATDRGDRRDPWHGVDLPTVFDAFGWAVVQIDGHDFGQIRAALRNDAGRATGGRPLVILARTIKGKGFSLAEGHFSWHSRVPTAGELDTARRELLAADSGNVG